MENKEIWTTSTETECFLCYFCSFIEKLAIIKKKHSEMNKYLDPNRNL